MSVERAITPTLRIPTSMITEELEGLWGRDVLRELDEVIKFYEVYTKGKEIKTEGTNGDYTAADLRSRLSASIIDKEARFLFSKQPDIIATDPTMNKKNAPVFTNLNNVLSKVLKVNNFNGKLLKAAKDCFIGRRVACFLNFNSQGISIHFSPSLEFVFEVDTINPDKLTKIVAFYTIQDSTDRLHQEIYKKKYWLADDGFCWVQEALYNGLGEVIEETIPETQTKFTFIPAVVIVNDGLTGDYQGVSEIEQLSESEGWFGRLNNADIDALRKSMNPIKYSIDINTATTKKLSHAAGAYWDLQSDQNGVNESASAKVGILESAMNYASPLDKTISRLRMDMLDQMDVPDTRTIDLKVASGKALKGVYWGLMVRCDEKMHTWRPALEMIATTIITGAQLYPESLIPYKVKLGTVDVEWEISVDNQYPLPEDEAEEKAIDLQEVNAQTMSRLAYMKKWRGLTSEEVQEELEQMAIEAEILDNSKIPEDDFNPVFAKADELDKKQLGDEPKAGE